MYYIYQSKSWIDVDLVLNLIKKISEFLTWNPSPFPVGIALTAICWPIMRINQNKIHVYA